MGGGAEDCHILRRINNWRFSLFLRPYPDEGLLTMHPHRICLIRAGRRAFLEILERAIATDVEEPHHRGSRRKARLLGWTSLCEVLKNCLHLRELFLQRVPPRLSNRGVSRQPPAARGALTWNGRGGAAGDNCFG